MWFVTLPMMRNIIAITALFSLIVTFANFDIVRILTPAADRQDPCVRHLGVLVGIQGGDIPLGATCRCSWSRSSRRAVFILRDITGGERSVMSTATSRRSRRADAREIRQHEPRPALGAALVVFLPRAVRDLLPDAADLHAHHSLKTSAEISAATNPWWVLHPTLRNYIELLDRRTYLPSSATPRSSPYSWSASRC
jgi:hypothetical protein